MIIDLLSIFKGKEIRYNAKRIEEISDDIEHIYRRIEQLKGEYSDLKKEYINTRIQLINIRGVVEDFKKNKIPQGGVECPRCWPATENKDKKTECA